MAKLLTWLQNKMASYILNSKIYDAKEKTLEAMVYDKTLDCKDSIRKELKGFQALDVNYHDYGHIILCLSVNNQDYCHIINIRRGQTLKEYKEMCAMIESRYGISPHFVDSPQGIGLDEFLAIR